MPDVSMPHPALPRIGDYAVVPGSLGPRRDFRISVGLREGWDPEGRVFDVSEAVRTRISPEMVPSGTCKVVRVGRERTTGDGTSPIMA